MNRLTEEERLREQVDENAEDARDHRCPPPAILINNLCTDLNAAGTSKPGALGTGVPVGGAPASRALATGFQAPNASDAGRRDTSPTYSHRGNRGGRNHNPPARVLNMSALEAEFNGE